ncbi:MAG: cysteine synthase A [Clostridia bacterium]
MKIYNSITELVGNTPLLKLNNYAKGQEIYAKLEYFNPAGSVKDRVAKNMIEEAEKQKLINKDTVIIEPTSGNTGIGLCAIACAKGYKVVLTMPESMSMERRNLLKAYGADLVLTEASKGMSGAIAKAEEFAKETANSFIPSQFENPANPNAHYKTTGAEIWEDTDGTVDILVAGVGTGGTITGTGKFLKEKNPNIKIIAVEPMKSAVLSGEKSGPHGLQGIGAGFIPKITDVSLFDEIIKVNEEDAYKNAKDLVAKEGILVGISAGAALYAAKETAEKYPNKKIVVILPDTGERYLSTPLFS